MKKFFLPLWIALALVQTGFAQTETFDIATFVPPKGWSRTQTNGVLVLQDRKTIQGRVEFCQIYLFPSQPSNASPAENFQNEWDLRVARPLGLAGHPSPQPETNPEGWTSLTDHADAISQGAPLRVILFTATGFGKFVSVVISVSPNSYQTELVNFFESLSFHANAEVQNPSQPSSPATGSDTSASGALANYVYENPQSWTREELPDRIVLRSPVYSNGEGCQLTMLPFRPLSHPLGDDAIGAFRGIFGTDPLTTYPSPPPRLARGTSPQGWEYFTIRKLVGGQEGEARTSGAILLEAKLGDQVATLVGTSKDFMVSNCFGLLRGDLWPKFFYSLQFKNAQPSGKELAAIKQRLTGTWIAATGSVGLRYEFKANGRYGGAGATQHRSRVSDTEVLQTTQAYFGDGSYSFDGNMIVLKGDDHKRTTYFFRLEQTSKNSGNTWGDELCLLDPGASGEVCYQKE